MIFPFRDNVPTTRFPFVTYTIVGVNVLLFFWLGGQEPTRQAEILARRRFVPKRVAQLFDPQVKVTVDLTPRAEQMFLPVRPLRKRVIQLPADRGEILTSFITTLFLHGSLLHLGGNMWFLLIFGNNVEDRLGHFLFLGFYFLGGLIATFSHWGFAAQSSVPVIGASGAVAAALGAYAVAFPTASVRCVVFLFILITVVDLPALLVLGFWFVEQLLEGLGAIRLGMNGGVAWWAHIGGFLAGMLLMPLLTAMQNAVAGSGEEDWPVSW